MTVHDSQSGDAVVLGSGPAGPRGQLGREPTQNQEVGPHRALRAPVAAEDGVLRGQVDLNPRDLIEDHDR
jgi:hypothetical protein